MLCSATSRWGFWWWCWGVSVLLLTRCCCSNAQILDENGGCQLLGLLPFTDERKGPHEALTNEGQETYGYGSWEDAKALGKATFSLMATIEIAVQHFNTRDTTIVPQLAELGSCDITFPDVYFEDSAYSRARAVDAIIKRTVEGGESGLDPTKVLCAVLGPALTRSHEGVSVMTENLNIPQFAYSAADYRLSNRHEYPTFARIIPSSFDYGNAMALYMQRDILQRSYIALIHVQSDYGEQFEEPLDESENFLPNFHVSAKEIIEDVAREQLEEAFEEIAEEGYHTIVVFWDRIEVLETIAEVADGYGLIGESYLWFFTSDMISPVPRKKLRYEKDSPVDRLLRGAVIFSNQENFFLDGEKDPLLKTWRQQGAPLLERLQRLHPLPQDHEAYFIGGHNYFQEEDPTEYASFLYDSVIAAGMSACRAQEMGTSHVEEVYKVDFTGASGHVVFGKKVEESDGQEEVIQQSNDRDVEGAKFGIFNVRPQQNIGSDGKRSYDIVLTHVYHGDESYPNPKDGFEEVEIAGRWKAVEGDEAFIYYDGTTQEPQPLRTTHDANFLSPKIQFIGLVMMGLGLWINVATGIWVFTMRNDARVKPSQPEFLYVMCFGSSMVSLSLFSLSFDEDKGWTQDDLSTLCGVFPWLFFLGYIMIYGALSSKLWRLQKILSMRRRTVKSWQMFLPLSLIIVVSILILTMWTVLRPYKWVRTDSSEEDEPLVTYGGCESEGLPFILALGVIAITLFGMACVLAWQLKGFQTSLAETNWIFFAVISQVQFWLIGIPLYIILDHSRDASYLISASLTFIYSTSMVMMVVWPKIYVWIRETHFGEVVDGPRRRHSRLFRELSRRALRTPTIDEEARKALEDTAEVKT